MVYNPSHRQLIQSRVNCYWQMDLSYCPNGVSPCATNNGNIRQIVLNDTMATRTQNFSYDSANRLQTAAEANGFAQTYGYDQYSNRWITPTSSLPGGNFHPTSAAWFDAATNRLQSAVGNTYFHDAAGNMIVEASTTFAYDAEGRMIRSTIPYATGTVITQYFYDGEGRRVKKQNQALGKTLYLYDAFGKLAVEFPEQAFAPCATCYLFTDQVNTTRLVLDQGGTVMKRADHMPFGEEILNGAPWANGRGSLYADNNPVRQQFTGYLRSEPYEWALDFANARYYRRSNGRFTSPDPLLSSGRPDNPQSWNRYGYGFNNPLRFIDPTGLFNWDSSLGGDATDDQLRKTMAKKEANRIIKQRKNITNALNKMAKSGDSALSGVASAYGSAGDNNGVTIAAGPVTPGAAAQAENAVPLGYDSRGNTEVTVTVPQNASGNGLFISLAHEGAHVQDAQNVGAFGTSGNVSMTRYDTEMHGYMLTMSAARYLGLPGASATVGSTTFQFWNPAWTQTDLQTQPRQNIDRFLNASPMYNNPARNKRLTDYVYQSGRGGN